MSQTEFISWVEIPVRVYANHQKREHATLTYPGCPGTIGIDDIEICLYDDPFCIAGSLRNLKDSILMKKNDDFIEEAYENQ